MKDVFFIYPNPNKTNPRGIRINNVVKNLQHIAPENNYSVLGFRNSLKTIVAEPYKINKFNYVFLLFKYMGVFKIGRKFSKISRILDPYIFIHFLIKIDLKIRLRKVKKLDNVVFVVVVSPFSNYLMVPWLRKNYPEAKIICDIGDPLYKNSVRYRDLRYSRVIENNALHNTDNIIVTNEQTIEHLSKEYSLSKTTFSTISQGVDLELLRLAEKSTKTIKKNTIIYAGSFYEGLRSPKEIINYLNNQNKYILCVYNSQPQKKLGNIFYKGTLPQKKLFQVIQSKEIILYIDNKQGIQTSGKIYEVLSFKKPILFIQGDEPSLPYELAKEFSNVFFCNNEANSIKEAINRISNYSEIRYNKDREKFSWSNRTTDYLKVITT